MDVRLTITRTIEQNAQTYFEKAKKIKKKIPGVKKTIEEYKKKLEHEELRIGKERAKIPVPIRKKEWFEKFRWFISSTGFLVIGGRDATTNEIVIKKYTEHDDIVFHTELAGSPFVIVKNPERKVIDEQTIQEAAECCASFSKSWKAGRSTAELYWITPEQVSKEAKAGEYLPKGSFMIHGKRNYLNPKINLAIGMYDGKVMCAPITAISTHMKNYVIIAQGESKLSETAKKIKRVIGGEVDDIIRALPPECVIQKIISTDVNKNK